MVGVGNPVQELQMMFDTGSNDFVVLDTDMNPDTFDAESTSLYNVNSSTTASVIDGCTFEEGVSGKTGFANYSAV